MGRGGEESHERGEAKRGEEVVLFFRNLRGRKSRKEQEQARNGANGGGPQTLKSRKGKGGVYGAFVRLIATRVVRK